jgi:ABC-type hemin transport system ATPase subunit
MQFSTFKIDSDDATPEKRLLDDPVQSMDELHITQLVALLRTLSKGHGRKVGVAVHDRPYCRIYAAADNFWLRAKISQPPKR